MAHQFDQYEIINLERVNEENAKELLSKLSQNLCKKLRKVCWGFWIS